MTSLDTTGFPSCRYNCGYNIGSCSCNYNCHNYGNCCPDYDNYCSMTTDWPATTDFPSCRYNCGYNLGSCSCTYNCQSYGNCCPDYDNYCSMTTDWPATTGAHDFLICLSDSNCPWFPG
ncbi:proteoglycan 4-like [Rhinichthys klamathensis goyatoka]|uniref:proteoglycan 4-like n=1 Tax=Rhinichthys klamathensis goyatoka TaxID=3034132 RepID=UPI0024B62096|nr:proteoglycan 4-like [Rhinichthys klamathensis goyatoka]